MKAMNLNETAMMVIMDACTGRDKIDDSLACMGRFEFEKAEELLNEADKSILAAHVAQTQVIQSQASGEDTEYSLLFIHAQDTLMTAHSELRIAKLLLPIFIAQQQEIKRLKKEG